MRLAKQYWLTVVLVAMTGAVDGATISVAPIAQWNFEESSGHVLDSSGNNYHGAFLANPSFVVRGTGSNAAPVSGGSNGYLDFSANTGHGRIRINDPADDASFSGDFYGVPGNTQARTVSSWVNRNNETANDQRIVDWGHNSNGNRWTLRVNSNGRVRLEIGGDGFIVGGGSLSDDGWHHVATTWADTSGDKTLSDARLYIDGRRQIIANSNYNQAINNDNLTSQRVILGSRLNDSTRFRGLLDDTAIYNQALTARDIRILATGSDVPLATLEYTAESWLPDVDGNSIRDQVGIFGVSGGSPGTHTDNSDLTRLGAGVTRQAVNNNQYLFEHAFNFGGGNNARLLQKARSANNNNGFDGGGLIPGDPSTSSASFEVWFRPDVGTLSEADADRVIWEFGGTGAGTSLVLDNTGGLLFTAKNDADLSGIQTNISGLIDGQQFIHALAVIDLDGTGTDGTNQIRLYLNGDLIGAADFDGSDWAGTDQGGIGGVFSGVAVADSLFGTNLTQYTGQIASFRYFTDALDQTDAQLLFASQIAPEPSSLALGGLAGLALIGWNWRRRRIGARVA